MPPEWGPALVALLREFGLPLAGLVAFASAILLKRKRKRDDGREVEGAALLVPGYQLDDARDELDALRASHSQREFEIRSEAANQIAYVEARRVEERAARLAADERLAAAVELVRAQGQTLDELRIDVARLTGIRRPGGGGDA